MIVFKFKKIRSKKRINRIVKFYKININNLIILKIKWKKLFFSKILIWIINNRFLNKQIKLILISYLQDQKKFEIKNNFIYLKKINKIIIKKLWFLI